MWHDLDKIRLSEDHFENFFYWPFLIWLHHTFQSPRAPELVVLKPSRIAEGKKYQSDLVVYGEYPFMLQYKVPIRDKKNQNIIRYKLTNQKQHNSLKSIANLYKGVFVCYALPIIPAAKLKFPEAPYFMSDWPYFYYDLEDYLWFVHIDGLDPHDGENHHIEIDLSNGTPVATMHSEPKKIEVLSLKAWTEKLKSYAKEGTAVDEIVNKIKKEYPVDSRKLNLMISYCQKS